MTNWERVQARYPALTKDLGMVKCAAHDDSHESLSVKRKGDDVLTHCFAGCGWKDVRDALGLTFTPQHTPNTAHTRTLPHVRIEAEYPYHNSAGDVIAVKRRMRLPDGTKSYAWTSLDDAGVMRGGFDKDKGKSQGDLPLYGAQIAVAGANRGHLVLIVEGEKCVNVADALGLFAVTNPEGGGGTATSYLPWRFAGFRPNTRFCVLPDNDTVGETHAARWVSALTPTFLCAVLRLPGLPPKGDLADYVEAQRAAGVSDAAIAAEINRLAWDAFPVPACLDPDAPLDLAGLSPAERLYLTCDDPDMKAVYRAMAYG